jgi:hypothetical protein
VGIHPSSATCDRLLELQIQLQLNRVLLRERQPGSLPSAMCDWRLAIPLTTPPRQVRTLALDRDPHRYLRASLSQANLPHFRRSGKGVSPGLPGKTPNNRAPIEHQSRNNRGTIESYARAGGWCLACTTPAAPVLAGRYLLARIARHHRRCADVARQLYPLALEVWPPLAIDFNGGQQPPARLPEA